MLVNKNLSLPEGVPPLFTIYFYLTGGCNLACQHCWINPIYQKEESAGPHLHYDLFSLAITEGKKLGLQHVRLTGGEPLLHPDFDRILDLIKENDLRVSIETNGTLMTANLANHLQQQRQKLDISVSLDGSRSNTHDEFRGVKGSFDRTIQGICYLVDADIHPQIIMSIHAGNYTEIEALVNLAEKNRAGSVKFNLVQPAGRGEKMVERGQVLSFEKLIEIGKWIETDLQMRTAIPLHYSWPMAFYSIKRLIGRRPDLCGVKNILGVLATGQFALCGIGVQIPELCYGIIGQDRMEDVWYSHPGIKKIRDAVPDHFGGICGECIFRKQCQGYCIAENYHQTHRLSSSYWFCARANELGLFPDGRVQKK